MKKRLVPLIPYLIVLGIDFYLLPLLMKNTGGAMLLMLCVMPLAAFFTALFCGMRRGFCFLLVPAAMLLFLPTLFLYYNISAWVYVIFYGVAVLAGMALGRVLYGRR